MRSSCMLNTYDWPEYWRSVWGQSRGVGHRADESLAHLFGCEGNP